AADRQGLQIRRDRHGVRAHGSQQASREDCRDAVTIALVSRTRRGASSAVHRRAGTHLPLDAMIVLPFFRRPASHQLFGRRMGATLDESWITNVRRSEIYRPTTAGLRRTDRRIARTVLGAASTADAAQSRQLLAAGQRPQLDAGGLRHEY